MERITLPGTDLEVPRLCLGTMTFGAQADEAAARAMVDMALEAGIDFVDTANGYAEGRAEEFLGRILEGRRQRVVLASKVGLQRRHDDALRGLSPTAIAAEIDGTLKRLRTDYLDLYYLHAPDASTPIQDTLGAMGELVRAGKVRYVAASNYAAWQVCRMQWLADRDPALPRVTVTQPMYNLLARGVEAEYLPMCRDLGVGTVVYNPLAGGLLTGKHRRQAPEPGGRFDRMANYRDRYWHAACFDAVEELVAACARARRSPVSAALGWLLQHSSADVVILGASRPEQLRQNLAAAAEGRLDDDLLTACERAWSRVGGVVPRYNR